MNEKLIIALDSPSLKRAEDLVEKLTPSVKIFKVGVELFTAAGPGAVEMIHRRGARVFLDLKFHDIPNTVSRAAERAAELGVFMFNLHCLGGETMMRGAAEAARKKAKELKVSPPLILGVTVLTSMDDADLKKVGIERSAGREVADLVKLAKRSGLDGVVASGWEIEEVRRLGGKDFLIVTPGIRPSSSVKDDQKRTITPREAIAKGADYIVVGRPISASLDPRRAAGAIIAEMAE